MDDVPLLVDEDSAYVIYDNSRKAEAAYCRDNITEGIYDGDGKKIGASYDQDSETDIEDSDSENVATKELRRLRHREKRSLIMQLYGVAIAEFWLQQLYQLVNSTATYISPLALHSLLAYISSIHDQTAAGSGSGGGSSGARYYSSATTNSSALPILPDGSKYSGGERHLSESAIIAVDRSGLIVFSPATAIALLFLGPFLKCICDGQNWNLSRRIAARRRALLIALIFRKTLRINITTATEAAKSLNSLITGDTGTIAEFCASTLHFLWCTPYEALLCLIMLFMVLGCSALAGVVIMIASVPLLSYAMKKMKNHSESYSGCKVREEKGEPNKMLSTNEKY
jgi:hypothetical protein